jgi:N-acetylneuraminate synthase
MTTRQTYIIAEIGVNHNGSLQLAKEMIEAAARTGADAVKFQAFKAAQLVSTSAAKADYQKRNTGQGNQYEMLSALELSDEAFLALRDFAKIQGVEFLSSVFDEQSLEMVVGLGVSRLKLGSGELTNGPLLDACARTGLPLIISAGMATMEDIYRSLGLLAHVYTHPQAPHSPQAWANAYASESGHSCLQQLVTVLHCTTEYPCPYNEVNLLALGKLQTALRLPVGYSDHTSGIHASLAAVALGAQVIEKHFTLDRTLPGPDHSASTEPQDFSSLVQQIRELEAALGVPEKIVQPSELKNAKVARRSLVALQPISRGTRFSIENIGSKRPGTGISPMRLWELLGTSASRDYEVGEMLDTCELEAVSGK